METIKGNLLDFPEDINVGLQNCNIRSTMGAGIALQIKNRYPEAYQADLDFLRPAEDRFGKFSMAGVGDGKSIVNLYAQDLGGRNLSETGVPFRLEYYEQALGSFLGVAHIYRDLDTMVLGFPWQIGAGLAGGDWGSIKEVTENLCEEYEVKAYWVKYEG